MTRLSWPDLRTDRHTILRLGIKVVEVLQRRNKHREPCIDNGQEFDNIINNKLIEKIGCRSPYQTSMSNWPICTSTEDMLKHKMFNPGIMNPTKKYGIKPCKALSMIDSKIDRWVADPEDNVTFVVMPFFPEQYRSMQLIKAIDVQSLNKSLKLLKLSEKFGLAARTCSTCLPPIEHVATWYDQFHKKKH